MLRRQSCEIRDRHEGVSIVGIVECVVVCQREVYSYISRNMC
jgi:hypothetical protein